MTAPEVMTWCGQNEIHANVFPNQLLKEMIGALAVPFLNEDNVTSTSVFSFVLWGCVYQKVWLLAKLWERPFLVIFLEVLRGLETTLMAVMASSGEANMKRRTLGILVSVGQTWACCLDDMHTDCCVESGSGCLCNGIFFLGWAAWEPGELGFQTLRRGKDVCSVALIILLIKNGATRQLHSKSELQTLKTLKEKPTHDTHVYNSSIQSRKIVVNVSPVWAMQWVLC